jgi:hypothetical protein
MLTTGMDNRARPGMACSECNDLLVAPKSSGYVSKHKVRHFWSCENCGHEIEMMVNPRMTPHRNSARALNARLSREQSRSAGAPLRQHAAAPRGSLTERRNLGPEGPARSSSSS